MQITENSIKNILNLAKAVKFGELVVKIQDSTITHIERREKFRLSNTDSIDKKGE